MIYILCPANCATGGPELLHQLGYKLRLLGFDAVMHYLNQRQDISPVCMEYIKYHVPYKEMIEDKEENIIIIPEVAIPLIHSIVLAKRVV